MIYFYGIEQVREIYLSAWLAARIVIMVSRPLARLPKLTEEEAKRERERERERERDRERERERER
jgi:hypothetical protein